MRVVKGGASKKTTQRRAPAHVILDRRPVNEAIIPLGFGLPWMLSSGGWLESLIHAKCSAALSIHVHGLWQHILLRNPEALCLRCIQSWVCLFWARWTSRPGRGSRCMPHALALDDIRNFPQGPMMYQAGSRPAHVQPRHGDWLPVLPDELRCRCRRPHLST